MLFSAFPRLGTPDTLSWSPIPYACICGRLSAGYAPESDVYSSQGHQTGVGQPGEGPRSAYRNFLTFHDQERGPQPLSWTVGPCGPLVSNEGRRFGFGNGVNFSGVFFTSCSLLSFPLLLARLRGVLLTLLERGPWELFASSCFLCVPRIRIRNAALHARTEAA